MPRDARLNRLLDDHGTPVALPPDGLLDLRQARGNPRRQARRSHHPRSPGRPPARAARRPSRASITDYAGVAAYMDIDALRRLMQEGGTRQRRASHGGCGALAGLSRKGEGSPAHRRARHQGCRARKLPQEHRRNDRSDAGTLLHLLHHRRFGVVYNSARIALSERSRDLATLRVVGFTHREVAAVLIGELASSRSSRCPSGC